MKKETILRLAMAVALLFAMNMNANAQFGKLKGIADKAKSTSKKVENADNSKTANVVSKAAKATMSPEQAEKLLAEKENYWLEEQGQTLKDMRQQQAQKERISKVKDKVQKDLKPTKIIKVIQMNLRSRKSSLDYSTWNRQNYPDMPEPYQSNEECDEVWRDIYLAFYEKGGKYYVVRPEFRTIHYTPEANTKYKKDFTPDNTFYPGLNPAVEIPADKAEKFFK
ncbi:MAG: hypothetical protein IJ067_09110 [Prevotella sp.]|nr:hypothetical protein [Prevotella sp.]